MTERTGTQLPGRRLAKLLALASRPGTPPEGTAARNAAEKLAARDGRTVIERASGAYVAVEEWLADVERELLDIAAGRSRQPPEAQIEKRRN